jgi:tRNA A37 threonylcarbamoyladenosine dehydratase
MGAANKLDSSLIRVGDLSHTQKCRMARVIRKELGRRGIRSGIKVVYSLEEYRPLSDAPSVPSNLPVSAPESAPARQRVTLGSSSYIPPMFGLTMAGEVIQALLAKTP